MAQLESIYTIRERNIEEAKHAFAQFMQKVENSFNERSASNPELYKNCTPIELESITYNLLVESCDNTPFHPNDIKLISGHNFPDILVSDYYGIEVKSTKKDKWTSTGSSIVESTRDETVDCIYILFGCLGNTPPSFKCRQYHECLSNIAVTHSPRYLIDMNLNETDNIFYKMRTSYNEFRKLEEKNKISQVRSYYIKKAKTENKIEIPWWMEGQTDEEYYNNINLSIFNDQSHLVKSDLTRRAFILFPSIFDKDPNIRYKQIALWLCNRYSLIWYNIRDSFSAGGVVKNINGIKLTSPYPNIVGKLLNYQQCIERLLKNPDLDIINDIRDYWDFNYNPEDLYNSWIDMIATAFLRNPNLVNIPIKHLIQNKAIPQ